ncbi:hypothetical protein GUJ93_ZPchr0002g24164, partial [Zizania palustris]
MILPLLLPIALCDRLSLPGLLTFVRKFPFDIKPYLEDEEVIGAPSSVVTQLPPEVRGFCHTCCTAWKTQWRPVMSVNPNCCNIIACFSNSIAICIRKVATK